MELLDLRLQVVRKEVGYVHGTVNGGQVITLNSRMTNQTRRCTNLRLSDLFLGGAFAWRPDRLVFTSRAFLLCDGEVPSARLSGWRDQ